MNLVSWLCAASAIILWASFATLVSHAPNVPPLLLAGVALSLGSVTCLFRAREWRVPLRTMAFGIVCLFTYQVSLVSAFRLAPIAEANLIHYLWPLLLVLLGTSVWRGADCAAKMAGAMLGFGGCIVAIGSASGGLAFSLTHSVGYA